jgi:hypothetical protein
MKPAMGVVSITIGLASPISNWNKVTMLLLVSTFSCAISDSQSYMSSGLDELLGHIPVTVLEYYLRSIPLVQVIFFEGLVPVR